MAQTQTEVGFTVGDHFAGKDPAVQALYDQLVAAARSWGRVVEEPKKTSIHLANHSAFAGIATRKVHLILTLKFDTPLDSPRVFKSEKVSAKRYHHELKLSQPQEVDAELVAWLKHAYELS